MSWAAIVVASVLGSLHCVGMCGGFVALVGGARGRGDHTLQLAYQATRGLTYVLLGGVAGLLGAGLEQGGALLGLQRAAGPLMGVALIALALGSLWPRQPDSPLVVLAGGRRRPSLVQRARVALTTSLQAHGVRAAAAAGLLSALLPCGWLWAYLLFAAGTGSPARGALAMGLFWLGTLPALLGVGLLAHTLRSRLGGHAPRIAAALMLTLGLLSLAGKLGPLPHEHDEASEASPSESSPSESESSLSESHAGEATPPAPAEPPHDAPCH